jgi:3-oxoacyl-[acyl-carrier-protein] synthase II
LSERRVVVTGLGLVSPVGNDVISSWDALKNGRSGINSLSHFDARSFSTRIGGSVKNFDCSPYMQAKEARRMDVFIQYGIAAGVQAFKDSGLLDSSANSVPLRV